MKLLKQFTAIFFVLVMLFQVLPIKSYYVDLDLTTVSLAEENSETSTKLPSLQETEEKLLHFDYLYYISLTSATLMYGKPSLLLDEQLHATLFKENLIKPPLYS